MQHHLVLAPDAAIDLQMHTMYSDGTWIPEQLIDYLVSERFGLAAITDHDRVDTLVSLQQLATRKRFPLLAAVEMSASWKFDVRTLDNQRETLLSGTPYMLYSVLIYFVRVAY